MRQPSFPKNANETQETEKVSFLVVKRIREAILDEVFKPEDHLGEVELAERFEVSRSPVREALVALEKEGTVIIGPYKGAIVKPLSAAEGLDLAELRLAAISLYYPSGVLARNPPQPIRLGGLRAGASVRYLLSASCSPLQA
jgi:DNA-binding FadR family transcriptional regulator